MSDTMVHERVNVRSTRERVNLCGDCGTRIHATELLCKECRGTRPTEEESEYESARRRR